MTERTINNYINRKFAYLFVILTLFIFLSVVFLIHGYIQAIMSNYIYDMTIDSIYSSLVQFDDTLALVEGSYDEIGTNILLDFKEELEEIDFYDEFDNFYVNNIFVNTIEKYRIQLDMLGILEQVNKETFYYIVNRSAEIIYTNNSNSPSVLNNKQKILPSVGEKIEIERFVFKENSNVFVKNTYVELSEDYILKVTLPMDRKLFDSILNRFVNLEDNFLFIRNIEISNKLDDILISDNEISPIEKIAEEPFVEKINNYTYTYYTAWENTDPDYFNSEVYYIRLDMDFSKEMLPFNRAITVFIFLVLFLSILIVFFINRRLINKISAPFSYLAENMNKIGTYDLSAVNDKFESTDLKEVNMLLSSYQGMTSELASSFEELRAVNEELEDSYKETSKLANNLNNIIQMASKLSTAVFDDKEEFLLELFYVAEKLIPEIDYGSVFIVENNQIKWLDAVGHDLSKIQKLDIDLSYFEELEELVYVKDLKKDKVKYPKNYLRDIMLSVKKPIKAFISVQLYVGDSLAGSLNYDIAKSSDANLSKQSLQTIRAFANLASAFMTIQNYKHIHEKFQREIILSMINILEIHDIYTKGHSENVAKISSLLARELGFSKEEVKNIEWAGLVHDIGKILVSKNILNKPGVLTAEEYQEIKRHTIWGYDVLTNSEELKDIATYVRHHHERWDGEGYPDGLKGEEIPLFARIITLADAWDTMRSDRVYRKKLSKEIALKEVIENSGKQFDPQVAKVAIKLIKEGKLN
ncbi:HD-GYP domain-containing protein [Natronospora cellulosivora (SeqCode)]